MVQRNVKQTGILTQVHIRAFTLFICDMIKRLQKISPYLALVTYNILITMVFPFLDAKINFLSLTILGLRILFLKTIVFNVLMTLRLWMS